MKQTSFTLGELASLTQSLLIGNPSHEITGFADLETAGVKDVSFLSNPRYIKAMHQSNAGAIFVAPGTLTPEEKNFLIHEDPSRAFQEAIEALKEPLLETAFHDIHPTAVLHPSCQLSKDVSIGPHAVLDAHVVIGKRCRIGSGVYIGPHTNIGEDCLIHPNVTIREGVQIGSRVIIQPGAVIGSCGFGYTTSKQGTHTKLAHIGTVIIEDDVEIGANTTIDRARFTETRIGKGSKLDNQVQIGHNVHIGAHNLICGQVGIAGSTTTGNHVVLAGQVGVNGHIKIGSGVIVAAQSGITKSLETPGQYGGFPAEPIKQFHRTQVYLRNLDRLTDSVRSLQEKFAQLHAQLHQERS